MMKNTSYIFTESQDCTSEVKQRASKESKLSPRHELNNQPCEKKLKTNSYDTSGSNIASGKPSLVTSAQTKENQTSQSRWNQRLEEQKKRAVDVRHYFSFPAL